MRCAILQNSLTLEALGYIWGCIHLGEGEGFWCPLLIGNMFISDGHIWYLFVGLYFPIPTMSFKPISDS